MPDLTSPLVLRALAATGAVVLIAGVGFLFANTQTSQTSSRGIAARPESPAAGSPVGRARSTNQSAEPLSVHYRRNGKSVATTVLTSNVNFTRKSLGEQAHEQVSRSPRFETAAPHAALGGAANGMSVSQIGECLTKVAAGRKVLVADLARYIGKRALIIIMRPLRIVDVLDVVVVGLACSASDTHAVTTFQVPAS